MVNTQRNSHTEAGHTPSKDPATRAPHNPTEDPNRPDPGGGRYDRARITLAAAISGVFLLGTLGILTHSLLFPRETKAQPPASAIPNGPWRGIVTWDNDSSTAVWFSARDGRVKHLTMHEPPPSCTRQQPLTIPMHATDKRLNTRSTSTGPWDIKASLESPILVTGTVTPRGDCSVGGRITAWPRNS